MEWETAINKLKGVLVIGIGTLKLKKRRDGSVAAQLVKKREDSKAKAAALNLKKSAKDVLPDPKPKGLERH